MSKTQVPRFWLQETKTFSDGAPQREEYDTDTDFIEECLRYDEEWRDQYECCDPQCSNTDCPQHFPETKQTMLDRCKERDKENGHE